MERLLVNGIAKKTQRKKQNRSLPSISVSIFFSFLIVFRCAHDFQQTDQYVWCVASGEKNAEWQIVNVTSVLQFISIQFLIDIIRFFFFFSSSFLSHVCSIYGDQWHRYAKINNNNRIENGTMTSISLCDTKQRESKRQLILELK